MKSNPRKECRPKEAWQNHTHMGKHCNNLTEQLKIYGDSYIYPFHMPGHKRQDMGMGHPEKLDITEVEGFDNLHHAEGILKEAQERMAHVFGADHSFFLVNGSTAGLLTAISATVPVGGKILIARNCHKAVYNAIYLRQLSVEYVYPMPTDLGIQGSIDPEDVKRMLEEDKKQKEQASVEGKNATEGIGAVLITSPTYDGVVSDIAAIADIVHAYDVPLIVDEAHGAHFGFSDGFAQKALALGADLVIESMHKTLPAFTQSAALHVKGERISLEKIKRFLAMYQSSSPSYLLMAGLDRCTQMLEDGCSVLMEHWSHWLEDFYQKCQDLKHLYVVPFVNAKERNPWKGIFGKDNSKILIMCQTTKLNGQQLSQMLLRTYGLQLEMDSGHYATALTSMMDTTVGFERLEEALHAIDKMLDTDCVVVEDQEKSATTKSDLEQGITEDFNWQQCIEELYQPVEKQMEIYQAMDSDGERKSFLEAEGCVSTEFTYLYPPGIPFIAPGEVITAKLVEKVAQLQAAGFDIQGLSDQSGQTIKVATK